MKTKIKEQRPALWSLGCICHPATLVGKYAAAHFPNWLEKFLKALWAFIGTSPKQLAAFAQIQAADAEISQHRLLKLSDTRWLSMNRVTVRTDEQFPNLQRFVQGVFDEDTSNLRFIRDCLANPWTQIYIRFVAYTSYILAKFNATFQARKPLIFGLRTRSRELITRLLLCVTMPSARDIIKSSPLALVDVDSLLADQAKARKLGDIDVGLKAKDSLALMGVSLDKFKEWLDRNEELRNSCDEQTRYLQSLLDNDPLSKWPLH